MVLVLTMLILALRVRKLGAMSDWGEDPVAPPSDWGSFKSFPAETNDDQAGEAWRPRPKVHRSKKLTG